VPGRDAQGEELLALRWSHIDLERGTLSIERGIVRVRVNLVEQGTKTTRVDGSHSIRDGRFIASASSAGAERAQVTGSAITSESFVFSHSVDGSTPWHPDSTSRASTDLPAGGRHRHSLHDLRHYVATAPSRRLGVDVRTVAGRLGHRNPSTTSTCTRISFKSLIGTCRNAGANL